MPYNLNISFLMLFFISQSSKICIASSGFGHGSRATMSFSEWNLSWKWKCWGSECLEEGVSGSENHRPLSEALMQMDKSEFLGKFRKPSAPSCPSRVVKGEFVKRCTGSCGLCVTPSCVGLQPSPWWWACISYWLADPTAGNVSWRWSRQEPDKLGSAGHLCFCLLLYLTENLPNTVTAACLLPYNSGTSYSFGQL